MWGILGQILLTASSFPLLSCPLPLCILPCLLPTPQPPPSEGAVESDPKVREVMSVVVGEGTGTDQRQYR